MTQLRKKLKTIFSVDEIRRANASTIKSANDIPKGLELAKDGKLSVHYIPFDTINTSAKVVLVGITPGLTQLTNALKEAQSQLKAGADRETVLKMSKKTGAFSGTMRPNLIALLDRIGLHKWLNLKSCNDLFDGASNLMHTTSVLRYPVFADGKNYNGTPNMVTNAFLREHLEKYFGEEAKVLSKAVFIPLGDKVSDALSHLASRGFLDRERILDGLPHPSGANAERIKYFLGQKDRSVLSVKTDPNKLDEALCKLQIQVAALGSY